ncbi:MAG TPA: hypothetical protein VEQ60_17390 [Longimicrobium sp.]|nr:hypothetical protein [Longimicrobium sp.]
MTLRRVAAAAGRVIYDSPEAARAASGLFCGRASLTVKWAASRLFVDAVVLPNETRAAFTLALRTSLNNPGPAPGRLRAAAERVER